MSESTVTEHDPSCPYGNEYSLTPGWQCMPCALIRKARAEERDRIITKIQRREVTLHNLASTAYAEIINEREVFGPEGPTMGDWVAFQKGMLYANVVIAEPDGIHSEWEPGQPLQ